MFNSAYCTLIVEADVFYNSNVDVIDLNLAKGNDKVDQRMLCRKLREFGNGGKLVKWLHGSLKGSCSNRYFLWEKFNLQLSPVVIVLKPILLVLALSDIPLLMPTVILTSCDTKDIKNRRWSSTLIPC